MDSLLTVGQMIQIMKLTIGKEWLFVKAFGQSFKLDCINIDKSSFPNASDYDYNYNTKDDLDDYSSQWNSEPCEDETIIKYNEAIKTGHARLVDKSTSKTFYILAFDLFDEEMRAKIEESYWKLITLFKLGIESLIFRKK